MLVSGHDTLESKLIEFVKTHAVKNYTLPETCTFTLSGQKKKISITHDSFSICNINGIETILSLGKINGNRGKKSRLALAVICTDISGLSDFDKIKAVCSAIKFDTANPYQLIVAVKYDGTLITCTEKLTALKKEKLLRSTANSFQKGITLNSKK